MECTGTSVPCSQRALITTLGARRSSVETVKPGRGISSESWQRRSRNAFQFFGFGRAGALLLVINAVLLSAVSLM